MENDGPVFDFAGEIAPPERDQLMIELATSIGMLGELRCTDKDKQVDVDVDVIRETIKTMKHAIAFVKAAS